MNPLLTWITTACILAPLSLAAPQLFPFSSLSSYFDQRTRNGPGGDQSAVIPQFIATAGNTVRANGGERFPRNHLPANHRPASLTDVPEKVATPVAYEIIIPHRIRQDNVNTQSAAIPLQAFLPQNIFNPPPENQKPLVYYPEVVVKPEEPKVKEETPVPPSAPPQITTPEETQPEKPPEKIAKNHAYPKKWQPELPKQVNKKTNAKSIAALEATVKEKREPGRQHKNSFLPAHQPPRGITEQEAAETGFASVTAGLRGLGDAGGGGGGGGGGDRVQFQMHGLQGPHSYKFGYDTGKGKNRQFRYEERDNKGHVRGHYGFYNKQGKLQIVNYEAHPEHGFRADGNFGKHSTI